MKEPSMEIVDPSKVVAVKSLKNYSTKDQEPFVLLTVANKHVVVVVVVVVSSVHRGHQSREQEAEKIPD